MLVKFPPALCYLVKLVHAEATHFGLDVFAHVFGTRQKTTLGLKPQNTHTHTELQSQSHIHMLLHPIRARTPAIHTSGRLQPPQNVTHLCRRTWPTQRG